MSTLCEQVYDELSLQYSQDFSITPAPRIPDPEGILDADLHEQVYLPRVEDTFLEHTVVAENAAGLREIFTTLEK